MREKFTMTFTRKELNYISMSLWLRIKELEKMGGMGNTPHLIRVSKRVLKRVDLEREK